MKAVLEAKCHGLWKQKLYDVLLNIFRSYERRKCLQKLQIIEIEGYDWNKVIQLCGISVTNAPCNKLKVDDRKLVSLQLKSACSAEKRLCNLKLPKSGFKIAKDWRWPLGWWRTTKRQMYFWACVHHVKLSKRIVRRKKIWCDWRWACSYVLCMDQTCRDIEICVK